LEADGRLPPLRKSLASILVIPQVKLCPDQNKGDALCSTAAKHTTARREERGAKIESGNGGYLV